MLKNKSLIVIFVSVFAFILATAGITASAFIGSGESFLTDGYILDPSSEEILTTEVNNQYYFSAGTKFKERYDEFVEFKDINKNKVSIDNNKFIHYLDGSLGALSKGVLIEADEGVVSDQAVYYSISDKTTLVKNGSSYSMTTLDSQKELTDFVWKISDNSYMVVSDEVTLHLSDSQEVTFPDYLQIEYVNEGIVRLVHQNGTYQTVSSEAFINLSNGVDLYLTGQYFEVNGTEGVKLSDMIVDSDSNVPVRENNDEITLPTFNVVNGKDGVAGADGEIGEEGKIGEEGEEGNDGTDGNNGSNGEAGYEGYDGTDGSMGSDGYEGYTGNAGANGENGEWGYDGKPGTDAENSDPSGYLAVTQLVPPTISLNTSTYEVTSNSINMDLAIDDPNALLQGSLKVEITDEKLNTISTDTVPQGATQTTIATSSLLPNKTYYVIISGQYDPDGDGADPIDGQFFIKKFTTDMLGIALNKKQVKQDEIQVEVAFPEDSQVDMYSVYAEYVDDSGNVQKIVETDKENQSNSDNSSKTYTFNNLSANKEYTIYLANVSMKSGELVTSDEKLLVKTLKKLPYCATNSGGTTNENPVSSVLSTVTKNERERTVSITMPNLTDPNQGIIGYRYELFETNSNSNLTTPSQIKESNTLEVVAFDVEENKSYTGRVVVLFDDNEKTTELVSKAPETVNMSQGDFPMASYQLVATEVGNESIGVNITLKDSAGKLLDNVNSDNPITVTISSVYGDTFTKTYTQSELAYYDANTAVIHFQQRGLRNETIYTLSVSGPVNTTSTAWSALTSEQQENYKNTFIGAVQYNTEQKALVDIIYKNLGGASLFSVRFNTKKAASQAATVTQDEVKDTFSTLDKMTFTLSNKDTGEVLGTTTVCDITEGSVNTKSEFYEQGFSSDGTNLNPQTTDNMTLTPASFGVSESRIQQGKTYLITLTNVYDYVGNELDFVAADASCEVKIEEKHMIVSDPNSQVHVTEIMNTPSQAGAYYNENLATNAVAGMRIEPLYSLGDIKTLRMYAYEVTGTTIPDNTQDITNNTASSYGLNLVAQKTILKDNSGNAARVGNSHIESSDFWTIFFDTETDDGSGSTYTFKRGKKYIFRYEILACGDAQTICNDEGNDETYPYCIYAKVNGTTQENVPFYRSNLYSAERQAPQVECYPSTSETNSVTWKYRIYDPDGCVNLAGNTGKEIQYRLYQTESGNDRTRDNYELDGTYGSTYFDGKVYLDGSTYTDNPSVGSQKTVGTGNTYTVACAVTTNKEAQFNDVKIENLTSDNLYYIMKVDYKLEDNGEVYSLRSRAMKFRKENTSTDSFEIIYEDNGGGEIKFEILGDSVVDYAALKITATCESESQSKVFDPVELEIKDGLKSGKKYAWAYIDSSLLSDWSGKSVSFDIDGYKNTFKHGVNSLFVSGNAGLTTNATASEVSAYSSNYYCLYDMVNEKYLALTANGFDSLENNAAKSFVIGGTAHTSPFNDTEDTAGSVPYIDVQTVTTPLISATSAQAYEKDEKVAFDSNGMYLCSSPGKYVSLNELSLKDMGSRTFTLAEILPSIAVSDMSTGVKTAKFEFDVHGDLTKYNDLELYAELSQVTDTVSARKAIKAQAENGVNYYSIDSTATTIDTDGGFKINKTDNTNGKYSIAITNLSPGTRYTLKIYVKKSDGSVVYLYDFAYKASAKLYDFETKDKVNIEIEQQDYQFVNYNNKSVSFRYQVDGAGMGYDLKYVLIAPNGGEIGSPATLPKQGTGIYAYYDNRFNGNTALTISLTPGSGPIWPGSSYKLKIWAEDLNPVGTSSEDIGSNTINITPVSFTMPASKYYVSSTDTTLTVNYALTDRYKVIKNSDSQVNGPFTLKIFDENNQQIGDTLTGLYGNITHEFQSLRENTTYTFEVEAEVDLDNDNVVDDTKFVDRFTATTSPVVSAKATAYVKSGKYTLRIYDETNFTGVATVKYTFYSASGATIGSGSVAIADMSTNDEGHEYQTNIGKSGSNEMQSVSCQYYDVNGNLVGNMLNNQFHID